MVADRFVMAGGIRTHYLDAGAGEPVVLLHSGEFGGRAEFSWRYTIDALAQHFHVLAPDMVGFGGTEKIFSFSDRNGFRVRHIRAFLDALGIGTAHFIGNSFGGSIIQSVASHDEPAWRIRSIVSVSGGGYAPDNAARRVLTEYDGTREAMRALLQVLFWDSRWWSDDRVEERWEEMHHQIRGSELKVYSPARHCPHIEFADDFNALAVDFLLRTSQFRTGRGDPGSHSS